MRWAVVYRFGLIQVALVSEQGHIAFIAPRRYVNEEAAEAAAGRLNAHDPRVVTADVPC